LEKIWGIETISINQSTKLIKIFISETIIHEKKEKASAYVNRVVAYMLRQTDRKWGLKTEILARKLPLDNQLK
jgi:hypothetical protein